MRLYRRQGPLGAKPVTARAIRSLPPLNDLPPLVEVTKLVTPRGTITSRIYHDHAAKVVAAQACQRIGRTETGRDSVGVPTLSPPALDSTRTTR
jgi:hypothetical protein